MAKLDAAAASAARLRFRVSGTLMQFGWMLTVLANAPMLFAVAGGPQVRDGVQFVVGSFLYYVSACPWGIGLMMLSLRPIDSRPIFGLCVFLVLFSLLMLFMMVFIATNRDWNGDFTPLAVILASVGAFIFLIIALFIIPALNIRAGVLARLFGPKMAPRQQLQRLWVAFRFMMSTMGSLFLGWMFVPVSMGFGIGITFGKYGPGAETSGFMLGCISFYLFALIMTPAVRGQMVRALGSIGKSDDKEQEAASVAALINTKSSAAEAFATAGKHFRAWPLFRLTREVLEDNKPDPTLHAMTIPAKLGDVSAFVSHSWSDSGTAKYDRLYEWSEEAPMVPEDHPDRANLTKGGPLLWLDKACIDQTAIEENLASLPIFLAGCKQLLVRAPLVSNRS